MAWIEFHLALRDHWKVNRLAGLMGVDYAHALGRLACLWCWTAQNAPKGNLADFSDDELCEGARISAKLPLKNYLKQVKLLDANDRIHDWGKHGLKLLESTRKRVREHRLRKHYSNVTVTPTLPNQTKPNLTIPNHTKSKESFEFLKDQTFNKTFLDFLEMRKKLKKPATRKAEDLILEKLHKLEIKSAIQSLERSIVGGWTDVYPENKGFLEKTPSNSIKSEAGKYDHIGT